MNSALARNLQSLARHARLMRSITHIFLVLSFLSLGHLGALQARAQDSDTGWMKFSARYPLAKGT